MAREKESSPEQVSSHACKILISDSSTDNNTIAVQMTVSPKLNNSNLFRSLNIPRSNSLDNSYYTLHYGQEQDTLLKLISRSYSLNSAITDREISTDDWEIVSNPNQDIIYPDMTHTTIEPPNILGHEIRIPNQYGTIHALIVRGSTIIIGTSNYAIKSFYIGEESNTLFSHTTPISNSEISSDIIKSVCFSPAIHPNDDNKIVWAGTETGSILAIDIETDKVLVKRMATHSHPITFILRHRNTELWTIDNGGNLNIWPVSPKMNSNDESTTINLLNTIPTRYLLASNLKTAILSIKKSILWCSAGRSIDKLDRSENESVPLIHIPSDLGEIIRLVIIPFHQNQIYALHLDGKITAWDIITFENIKSMIISVDKLTSIASVGDYHLWVGYNNGTIAIYDTRYDPWIVIKIWKAHRNPVTKLQVDDFSIIESVSVVSMDSAGHLAIWDGLLADDWFEEQMVASVSEYSDSNETNVMICSWNMDAIKPEVLSEWDKEKIHEWLNGMSDPDIIMIGIQEIVDLGSKTITAKSLLALSKKIDTIQEADELLTHRYMLWHDYFISIINTNFGKGKYEIIKTDQMVGLFSCIFIKTSHTKRVRECDSTVVKTGFRVMTKGLHGNKGGIATRFILDDTSLCFVNCHLASGQSHVLQRNADIEGVLNSAKFSPVKDSNVFSRETDGSSILDHETCFLSGDLNYRIAMSREQVLSLLSETGNKKFEAWETLQREDQLKQQQVLNPLFRLFNFKEAPILFDPTYKYDRGSDLYDSSEKKRIPAWCDRVLYRAPSTLTNVYYRRHEIKASDHRPISAGFTVPVKTIIPEKKQQVEERIRLEWRTNMIRLLKENKIRYITNYDLCDENEAEGRLDKADWDVEKVVMDLYHDKGNFIL